MKFDLLSFILGILCAGGALLLLRLLRPDKAQKNAPATEQQSDFELQLQQAQPQNLSAAAEEVPPGLVMRYRSILLLLQQGMSTSEVAELLHLSEEEINQVARLGG